MTKPVFFRTPTVKSKVGVDREQNALLGFVVAQAGLAKGHGAELDSKTLQTLLKLGNDKPGGHKMRFTHPNLSNDGLGKFLGKAKNFRMDGDQLRADGFLSPMASKTPHGDLGGYVLDLAEEEPDEFGASVAMLADLETRLDEDGKPQKDATGADLPPVFRPTKLRAVDIVDDPAATDSIFSTDNAPDAQTRMVSQFLDSLGESPEEIARRIDAFKARYLQTKGVAMNDATKTESATSATPPTDPPKTDAKPVEVAKAADELLRQATLDAERTRASAITSLCDLQKCPALAADLISEGVSFDEAKARVKKHLAAANVPVSSGAAPSDATKPPDDPDQIYRDEYRANEKTLSIFGDEASYVASRKVDAAGGFLPLHNEGKADS